MMLRSMLPRGQSGVAFALAPEISWRSVRLPVKASGKQEASWARHDLHALRG
jgi:hypothetical protein